jgi:hypothetical protein
MVMPALRAIDRAKDAEAGMKALEEFESGAGVILRSPRAGGATGSTSRPSSPIRKACAGSSTPRMRSTSSFCARVLFMGSASDLAAKRGVSAASAARRPIRSLPD